jgi:adenine/guanine phosphoribosyltransferase-like PRPP-binding protein
MHYFLTRHQPDDRKQIHASEDYLYEAMGDPKVLRDDFKRRMTRQHIQYDTLVGTGLSGALVVPTLARALHKKWLIVRKDNDSSHAYNQVEGDLGRRWMFVDDLIATGSTRQRVKDAVRDFAADADFKTTYVGDYLYTTGQFYPSAESGHRRPDPWV